MVYAMSDEEYPIDATLLVNVDQTSVVLIPGGNDRTYDEKGIKQVGAIGKDKKRAFTAVLAISAEGRLLPTQSIWKGKTEQSLPSYKTSQRKEAEDKGHRFVAREKSH